jgi:hypothetical protein
MRPKRLGHEDTEAATAGSRAEIDGSNEMLIVAQTCGAAVRRSIPAVKLGGPILLQLPDVRLFNILQAGDLERQWRVCRPG